MTFEKEKKMATIISIETSTNVCSACLSHDGKILENKEDYKGQNHSVVLGGYVKELLDKAKELNLTVDAVAVSCGPGSYTGLRIGVSTAKGLCYGMDAKLIAVNTLKAMASGVIRTHCEIADGSWLCPMIDARRMEVYNAFYNLSLTQQKEIAATIIDSNSFEDIVKEHPIVCFGNGAEKCKEPLSNNRISFIDDIVPLAKDMVPLAENQFKAGQFEDVAYFEPFYLKEFVAEHSQKKLF